MTTLSWAAAGYLEQVVSERGGGERLVVRLSRSGSSWRLRLDAPREGDEVISLEGRMILAYPSELGHTLAEASLDLVEDGDRPRLLLSVPEDSV